MERAPRAPAFPFSPLSGEGRMGANYLTVRIRHGRGVVIAIVVLALLAALAYTGYAGTAVYQQLDSGRTELAAAQAGMKTATQSRDAGQLRLAAAPLRQAGAGLTQAGPPAPHDPAPPP